MVSSKDVAKLAGVSQTTVSRVLNKSTAVSQSTKQKVMRAIEELNYRPNSIARSLINRKTGSIALLSGPLYNPFFVETTTSIISYAKNKGYNVNVYFEDTGDNMSVYEDVLARNVDGIILSSMLYDDPIFDQLKKLNMPFVMFNRKHREVGHFVEMDNFQAGKIAAEHLIKLNHKNIAWVGGPKSMTTFKGRLEGFQNALSSFDIPSNKEDIITTNTKREAIFQALSVVMASKNRPTAICAATDSIAIYIMDYLIEKGYRIPEDISVIGIDNVYLSSHQSFKLTTVGLTVDQNLGRIGIETLIKQIEKGNIHSDFMQKTIPAKLIVRETTREI